MRILGSDVSISRRQALIALLICSYVLGLVLVVMALVRVNRLTREVARLEAEIKHHTIMAQDSLTYVLERIEGLERLLYGDVLAKVDKNTAMHEAGARIAGSKQPEQWMRNRDHELRLRIERLEKWRLQWENMR